MESFRTQELSIRGEAATQATMLTTATPDALVPRSHPIRRIKPMVDSALAALSPTFSRLYSVNAKSQWTLFRVVAQGKCPLTCSAIMSLRSDLDGIRR